MVQNTMHNIKISIVIYPKTKIIYCNILKEGITKQNL